MKDIVVGERSSVFYDEEKHIYIKTFNPKFKMKLKYFLGIRRFPGKNFYFISKLLNSLNIKTPEIIEYSNYKVVTKELNGVCLEKELKKGNKELEDKFSRLITTLFTNKIYSGDLSPDNFIVVDNEIYALDLEDYRAGRLYIFSLKKALKRVRGKVSKEIYDEIVNRVK